MATEASPSPRQATQRFRSPGSVRAGSLRLQHDLTDADLSAQKGGVPSVLGAGGDWVRRPPLGAPCQRPVVDPPSGSRNPALLRA